MDDIPVEVVFMVLEKLQRWTISPDPFSHLTETSTDGTEGWLKHTAESRRDICNFRLVSRKLCSESFKTFGELLGDRVFRMTKVGLEDLEAISAVNALRPHIRTLTFGGAHFSSSYETGDTQNQFLDDTLAAVPEPDRERLKTAYAKARDWIRSNPDTYVRQLATVLGHFPNFGTLRFLVSDDPGVHRHLGGWLGPGDEEIIAQARHDRYPLPLEGDSLYQRTRWAAVYNASYYELVLTAIKDAGTSIQDFRVGSRCLLPNSCFMSIMGATDFVTSLRRLNHVVTASSLVETDVTRLLALLAPECDRSSWVKPWSSFPKLTHLSMSMAPDAAFQGFTEATSSLLNALKPLPRLQHLTIRGPWSYAEEDLVDLVVAHANSLTHLVLIGPTLASGTWPSIIKRLVPFVSYQMEHLGIRNASLRTTDGNYLSHLTSGWPAFVEAIAPVIEKHAAYTVCVTSGDQEYIHYPTTLAEKQVVGQLHQDKCAITS